MAESLAAISLCSVYVRKCNFRFWLLKSVKNWLASRNVDHFEATMFLFMSKVVSCPFIFYHVHMTLLFTKSHQHLV